MVARGNSRFFQKRIPISLTSKPNLPPVRVELHGESRKAIARKVALLPAYAGEVFERSLASEGAGWMSDSEAMHPRGLDWAEEAAFQAFVAGLRTLERAIKERPSFTDLRIDQLIGLKAYGSLSY